MLLSELCKKHIVTIEKGASLVEAAHSMKRNRIGALVVVDDYALKIPVGIVTDRDLALRGYGRALLPSENVEKIMNKHLVTVSEKDEVSKSLEKMLMGEIRRIIVLNEQGEVVGLISLDDLFQKYAKDISRLSSIIQIQLEKPIDQSYWDHVIL